MSVHAFAELRAHLGHELKCVAYGPAAAPDNVAIECETCGSVLLDYDLPDAEDDPYRAAARKEYADEGAVDIDDGAEVSHSADGAYVHAWVWVPARWVSPRGT